MGKIHLIAVFIISWFLVCCEGEFIESTLPTIILKTPDGKCEEGFVDLENEKNLNVVFKWEASKFQFEQGQLALINRGTNDTIKKVNIQISEEEELINLERGTWYRWQIIGTSQQTNQKVASNTKDFFSEFITDESAPYPVLFEEPINLDDKWVFEWDSPENETKSDLKYKAFFSTNPIEKDSPIKLYELEFKQYEEEFVSSDRTKRIEQPKAGLRAGDYVFMVQAIYSFNSSELITSSYLRVNAPIDY
ncbi:MAG: hypothetical protein Mars2KO_14920 [Maribacter sp.]